jgi:hypothetical protein
MTATEIALQGLLINFSIRHRIILSNSIQYFPLISVQFFPLFRSAEYGFYDA